MEKYNYNVKSLLGTLRERMQERSVPSMSTIFQICLQILM